LGQQLLEQNQQLHHRLSHTPAKQSRRNGVDEEYIRYLEGELEQSTPIRPAHPVRDQDSATNTPRRRRDLMAENERLEMELERKSVECEELQIKLRRLARDKVVELRNIRPRSVSDTTPLTISTELLRPENIKSDEKTDIWREKYEQSMRELERISGELERIRRKSAHNQVSTFCKVDQVKKDSPETLVELLANVLMAALVAPVILVKRYIEGNK
jgi:hypothetical protein